MNMKRIVCILLVFALCASFVFTLCACDTPSYDGLSIVVTIFPAYDWVRSIIGEGDAELTLLLDSGVDLHNYQPTAEDIIRISSCDLFIYVGGESDEWVGDVLKNAVNPDMIVINLLEMLGDSAIEGEHDDHEEHEEHEGEHEGEYDEHVWLSLKNAQIFCAGIRDALCRLDPDGKERYEDNLAAYRTELSALDGEYSKAVEEGSRDAILFADRFPFAYLAHDYGIEHYAAFSGCSSESEASFETVAHLAGKIDELGLGVVLITEGSDGRIAETVIANTAAKDARVLRIDSMQSTTMGDVEGGVSYLSIMRDNLTVLTEALK